MRTRHSYRITRRSAEQLLDGSAAPGPEPLIHVLRAATAPGRDRELAGEQAATAAFEAHHLGPVTQTSSRRRKMLAKILTVKALALTTAASSFVRVAEG